MVAPVAGVPILKLGLLAVRQIAKPIATRAKATAKESAVFRSIVVWIGRGLHRTSIQVTRLAEGKVSLEYITPLSETAAVDRGAEFVSELVIYVVAASTTIYEFARAQQDKKSREKEAELEEQKRKEEALANERRQWEAFAAMDRRMTLLDEQILLLRRERERETEKESARHSSWYRHLFGSRATPPTEKDPAGS